MTTDRIEKTERVRPAAGWRWRRVAGSLGVAAILAAVSVLPFGIDKAIDETPLPSLDVETSTVVLDRNGRLLRPFQVADGRWRMPVTLDEVDPTFISFLLAYEDRRFRDHRGVDARAVVRAAGQFVAAGGRIVSGASTITMQVARLIEDANTRSLAGKMAQARSALALERRLTKDDILTLYLTLAPYGGNLEGIRAASLAYLGKEPSRLTIGEAALLVALPQSPETRRPDRHRATAEAARNRVLERMVLAGVINAEEAVAARREPMPKRRKAFPKYAAHAAERVRLEDPEKGAHHLTIERRLQKRLETLIADRVTGLGKHMSAALIVVDHENGEVLASVGSPNLLDGERGGFIDMSRAVRSPGSTLKPLIYGIALEAGLVHPESLIEDRPTSFGGYTPTNFDGGYNGTVTVRQALQRSLNVPAVLLLDAVGPAKLVGRMKRAGAAPVLPDLSAPNLAVGLGGVGVTLRDLAMLYAALARGGQPVSLVDRLDVPPATERPSSQRVLDEKSAWYVSDILAGAPPPANASSIGIAFKTGTSYGYRDAWAVGYDGRHVIAVWVGRPDAQPISRMTGIEAAAPILFDAFARLESERVPFGPAPRGTLIATSHDLPPPLKRFRHPSEGIVERETGPEIAFPRDGVRVDLGLGGTRAMELALKVRNGAPPFVWLVNGQPLAREPFSREARWQPDSPGYATVSVIDADGKADRVTVFLE
ncbi:MAG: penicillin-binding protein 1C [Hyphomicrobiales bacterium]|nr:MAG: penicillin-binding protein 1C [Hyphomicrobiales bacterium]